MDRSRNNNAVLERHGSFKKMPGFSLAPTGPERTVLRLTPKVFLVGITLIKLTTNKLTRARLTVMLKHY
jgi:hypothetical protein